VQQVNPDDFELVDRLVSLYDEPYADSSAMPTYRVCELARRRVTVALSGDGGDESFAGYRRHRWHMKEEAIRSRLPHRVRRSAFGLLGWVYPKADWAPKVLRAKTTFQALARDSLDAYFHSVCVVGDRLRDQLYSDRFRAELQGYHALEVFRRHAQNGPEHPLSLIQYLDYKTYLSGDILTKVDRASMAHSLEVRVPILDHEFVEWVCGLPPELKLRRGDGKYVFKRALQPYLPADVLYRPKMGFGVPLARWFRGPLKDRVREAVLSPALLDTDFFDRRALRNLLDQHQSGVSDHSAAIWSLLMLAGFLRRD
jgi:asparagine synthase (glutamine-hydrolysing)